MNSLLTSLPDFPGGPGGPRGPIGPCWNKQQCELVQKKWKGKENTMLDVYFIFLSEMCAIWMEGGHS